MSGEREVQVGWLGPYGIVPGGMDVDPAPHWHPVYVKVPSQQGGSRMGERYWKATRPNGADFRTGTVKYEVGKTVTHPRRLVANDPSTYLSVSSVPTDCTGFSWPCRLFVVEGHGEPVRARGLPNKRCFSSVTVVEERPAWEVFGPQGREVAWVIERTATLTPTEAAHLVASWAASWDASWDASWVAARVAARGAARAAAMAASRGAVLAAARDAAWAAAMAAARGAAWDASRGAVLAYLARDLISDDHFRALAGPWLSVIGEPVLDKGEPDE